MMATDAGKIFVFEIQVGVPPFGGPQKFWAILHCKIIIFGHFEIQVQSKVQDF